MKTPIDLKKMVKENTAFRWVLDTGKYGQVILMSLRKGDDLGEEIHPTTDEFYYVIDGKAEIKLEGKPYPFEEHAAMFVPAGMRHQIINTGKDDLKLFVLFTSPLYPATERIETREKALTGRV